MKTIQLRALWFKAVASATKTITVDDDFFDQIQCGIPDSQLAKMLGIYATDKVRRYQIQYEGKIIYSSDNKSSSSYPCDSKPW